MVFAGGRGRAHPLEFDWPDRVTRAWALEGATGKGVRVCVLDSGVEPDHPKVGALAEAVVVTIGEDGEANVVPDDEGDLCGHGTACAGIIRALAPECEIHSVRVLGPGFTGSGPILLGGLRWAVEQGFDVINMSLSTTKRQFAEVLHELADTAYFNRTILVASAHNMPVESYPWRFSSVISVGSHAEPGLADVLLQPEPAGRVLRARRRRRPAVARRRDDPRDGNSFATPHMSGICALVRSKHPELTPFQLKSVLHLIADNVGGRQ